MDDTQTREVADEVNSFTPTPLSVRIFKHVWKSLNVWNLFFERPSPLREVDVHVPAMSAVLNGLKLYIKGRNM